MPVVPGRCSRNQTNFVRLCSAVRLESSPTLAGPWTEVEASPAPSFAVPVEPAANRFYRLVTAF